MNKLLTLLAVFLLIGCTSGGSNHENVQPDQYHMAQLEGHLNAQPAAIAEATQTAFHTLGIIGISETSSDLDARIIGRTTHDKKVTVRVKKTPEAGSTVQIHIGTFGDQALSESLFNEIKRNL